MLIDDVERIIRLKPGLKASQIAAEIFGAAGYPERVNSLLPCFAGSAESSVAATAVPAIPTPIIPWRLTAARPTASLKCLKTNARRNDYRVVKRGNSQVQKELVTLDNHTAHLTAHKCQHL